KGNHLLEGLAAVVGSGNRHVHVAPLLGLSLFSARSRGLLLKSGVWPGLSPRSPGSAAPGLRGLRPGHTPPTPGLLARHEGTCRQHYRVPGNDHISTGIHGEMFRSRPLTPATVRPSARNAWSGAG